MIQEKQAKVKAEKPNLLSRRENYMVWVPVSVRAKRPVQSVYAFRNFSKALA